jgi:hypothetical protein
MSRRSEDSEVTLTEEMETRLPNRGNTEVGQRGSGHLAVSPSGWVADLIKPAQRPCWLGDKAVGKPGREGRI